MSILVEYFPFIISLIALGAVAGFLAGLLGVGGGIVLVPGLYMIFSTLSDPLGLDLNHIMHVCVGTSLATIIPTGLSSVRAHYKKSSVDFSLVQRMCVGILIGVAFGSFLASLLDAKAMKIVFASALLPLAWLMVAGGRVKKLQISPDYLRLPFTGFAGVIIGSISTLIGIGGATLSVPYMSMHDVKIHRAVGTASALGLVISLPAAISFIYMGWGIKGLPPFSFGYVNFLAWAFIIPVGVLMAPVGARVSHKLSTDRLKKVFAVFVVFVALNMWRKILMG